MTRTLELIQSYLRVNSQRRKDASRVVVFLKMCVQLGNGLLIWRVEICWIVWASQRCSLLRRSIVQLEAPVAAGSGV